MKKMLPLLIGVLCVIAGFTVVIITDKSGWISGTRTEETTGNCAHGMTSTGCPFCDKSLIETMGFCAEHGVAEALCTRCNPAVIAAFKTPGDWCAGHNVPESQCTICNPDILISKGPKESSSAPAPAIHPLKVPVKTKTFPYTQ